MAQMIPALRPRKIIPETSILIQWSNIDDGERASSHSHANKRNKPAEIPKENLEIPQWTVQTEDDQKNCFQLPCTYIRYQDEYNIIEYELDEKDEHFLSQLQRKCDIDEDTLESAIDYFEKESFLAKEYTLLVPVKDEKDLSICCVCHKLELQSEDSPFLMKCEGCGILSHSCCQGLEDEPENWFCDRCLYEENGAKSNPSKLRFKERCMKLRRERKCAYCQKPDGSMLFRNDEWVHTICVAWLPGFSFNAGESNIKQCLLKMKCTVCKGTEHLVHCSESTCKIHYHGSCAQELGYYFEITPEGKPLSCCSAHSMKKKSKIFQTLLPLGQGRVDIGQFRTSTTKIELEKLINKNISEDTFKALWEYWKKKRLASDYGRIPLIPRLKIEKDLLQELSMKDEQTKLNEAKLRWESLKTKLLPKKKTTVNNSSTLSLSARSPAIREKNKTKEPIRQQQQQQQRPINNNKTRSRPFQQPLQLNNDYSDEIDDVETNVEESDYESDVIQYVDDEESDEIEIIQDNIATRTPKNNGISKRISKPSKYLNKIDFAFPARDLRKCIESKKRSTKSKTININNKHKPIQQQQEEQEEQEVEQEEEQDEEQDDGEEEEDDEEEQQEEDESEKSEHNEKESSPIRSGKKRPFESATLFPSPGSILYKRVKRDTTNKNINNNNNKSNNNNDNNKNNTNNNNGKKLLFKLDQASQIDVMKVDKKAIMQEKSTKTRPPTRSSPGKIASGLPTYYGTGENRIAWTPNVQFSQTGDKKNSAFLFGAGFPSPLSPSERPAKRTW